MPTLTACPFCSLPTNRIVDHNAFAIAIRDAYPVSPGHTLVISTRHVATFFEATAAERSALLSLLDTSKLQLDAEFAPAAYNIGINDGVAAGQTVPHLHIHLIPRYRHDSEDPRGGVRWVVPAKAKYWS